MRYLMKTLIPAFIIILLTLCFFANAQWNIPDIAKNTNPPVEPTYKLTEIGKNLYIKNCVQCHGMPGEGKNNTKINATDLGNGDYQSNHNVGQTYYQLNEGMGFMPSFKDKFNEDDKWFIAFYIKSFDKEFKISGEKIKAKNGAIELKTDESAKTIIANASIVDKNGISNPASEVEIVFYVKRIFGNLPLGDAVITDKKGNALLNFPNTVPGDESGNLKIIAAFKDQDAYGTAIKSVDKNWGIPLQIVNPVLNRTLWGPNTRVPLWLLFSYFIVTGGVWFTIFYVIFQITRIKKAGNKH